MTHRPRFGDRAIAFAAIWIGAETTTWACPICFQIEDGPVSGGVRAAVLVLVGVTAVVLTAFGRFAWRMATAEAQSLGPRAQGHEPQPWSPTPRAPGPETHCPRPHTSSPV